MERSSSSAAALPAAFWSVGATGEGASRAGMRHLRRGGSTGLHGGAHRGRREGLRSRSENHTQSASGDGETRISAWSASCAVFCGWSRVSLVARLIGAVQGAGHPVMVLCCRSPRLSRAARRRRACWPSKVKIWQMADRFHLRRRCEHSCLKQGELGCACYLSRLLRRLSPPLLASRAPSVGFP